MDGFPATTLYTIESKYETIQLMLEYEYMFITNYYVCRGSILYWI